MKNSPPISIFDKFPLILLEMAGKTEHTEKKFENFWSMALYLYDARLIKRNAI